MFEYIDFFKEHIIDSSEKVLPTTLSDTTITVKEAKQELNRLIGLIRSGQEELMFKNILPFIDDRLDYISFKKLLNQADYDISNLSDSVIRIIEKLQTLILIIDGTLLSPINNQLLEIESDIIKLEAEQLIQNQTTENVEIFSPMTSGNFIDKEKAISIIVTTPGIDRELSIDNYCIVDVTDKKIKLPIINNENFNISHMEIMLADTTQSNITESEIREGALLSYRIILDADNNRYARLAIKVETTIKTKVSTLKLDIENSYDIKTVDIKAINFEDGTGQLVDIYNGPLSTISTMTTIKTNDIYTNTFFIIFENYNGKIIINENENNINNIIDETLSSAIGINTGPAQPNIENIQEKKKFDFIISNIELNNTEYDKKGIIFTSETISYPIKSYGIITNDTIGDNTNIEYNIIRAAYAKDGSLMSMCKVPVLPMGVTTISSERLLLRYKFANSIFSSADNATATCGILNFNAHGENSNIADNLNELKVYENGREMSSPTINIFNNEITQNIGDAEYFFPDLNIMLSDGTATLMSMRHFTVVQIVSPKYGAVYTVEYAPAYTKLQLPKDRMMSVSKAGRYDNEGIIYFENNILGQEIAKTKIYETIVLYDNNYSSKANVSINSLTRYTSTFKG